ncbi:uncharacterized protein LOC124133270 [Haliotis rufescens]|uniref:uncharacterized protein LOC124133270 n=1 Tax=Haliotis rufescens TaxID=6454 RepID=UPI00201E9FC9|nr:uncharacterized protein LOC124133270 [Haliotis rufescens]
MTTDLFEVVKRNSIRQVKLVLEAGYDVNARNERMETPLMASVMHVHDPDCRFGVIKLLLASGADINLQNGRGQTVIMYGCILNQLDTVMQLLQFNNLHADLTDTDGNTGLMYACALGHNDIVKVFIDYHRKGHLSLDLLKKNYDGMGALEHAAQGGHLDVVKLISSCARAADSNQEISNMATDCEWVEEQAPNPTPTDHKSQSMNEKMHQFIQEVQDASVEESCDEIKPSPCAGLPPPDVIITGEEYVQNEANILSEQNNKRLNNPHVAPSTAPRSPSVNRRLKSAARRTAEQLSDEETELSLASLGELVTTVRECAREIREIYHHPDKDEKSKHSKKGKGAGKKVKSEKSKMADVDNADLKRRRASGPGVLSKDRNQSELDTKDADLALNQTWPKRSTSSLSVRLSASNTSLNRDEPGYRSPSPAVAPPSGECGDKTLLQEKHILDKVFCRLNNSKVIWGGDTPPRENSTREPPSKATMLVRDQFSSYGNPLPGIHRSTGCLPPIRDGGRHRQVAHTHVLNKVPGGPGTEGGDSVEGSCSDGEGEEDVAIGIFMAV